MIEYEIIDLDETTFDEDLLELDHTMKNMEVSLLDLDDEWMDTILDEEFDNLD